MSINKRLERLEKNRAPAAPAVVYDMRIPPDGLTREEYAEWASTLPADCFTLDLGAAGVKGGDV